MLAFLEARWVWAGTSWVCSLLLTLWLLALLFPTARPGSPKESGLWKEEPVGGTQKPSTDLQPAGSPLAGTTHRKEHL